ncbi:hypothetical protein A6S26_16675 [Nostoc sp. ATCC 43529]|nr:hypothetical protein A6S26_16675 [Nostoc sp. ATCC 43529]
MTQTLRKLVTFNEFIAQYPDNPQKRYELHDGVIVEMAQPTGDHEEVTGFLVTPPSPSRRGRLGGFVLSNSR